MEIAVNVDLSINIDIAIDVSAASGAAVHILIAANA
jgi:hypothetical protein